MNLRSVITVVFTGCCAYFLGGLSVHAAGPRDGPVAEPSAAAREPGGLILEQTLAERPANPGSTMFQILPPGETGVVTENPYDDPRMWGSRFNAFEVGAIGTGIAIGDYDNDGRPDIFVVAKTRSCRLFRNLGNWKFEDVTAKAEVGDTGTAAAEWKQGATFVDVNNDGLLDIYVCRYDAPNLLYINQGNGTFREEAAARGLAVKDACVMAAFYDYDRDGWLDVFIQTNLFETGNPEGQRNYLFHNNRDGTFTDVTRTAGIGGQAQGHSAVWWDYDGDGWPDLYVANDFSASDKLYHNNRDGTFSNVIDAVVPHMPFSSMGADIGDVNNDGLVDFYAADMAATTHQKDQRTTADMRSGQFDLPDDSPAAPQVMRSALYLNTGRGRMLEAANLAGISATDWTWSPRFEDLDNDGRIDLFVTNGMVREAHNADLTARRQQTQSIAESIRMEKASPVLAEQHLAFRNLGDLQFADVSAAWGLNQRGVSFGAAFGDLGGDGNLDIVYSNYEDGVTFLRNACDTGHRITIALRGKQSNRFGVGATVHLETASGIQVRVLGLARGVLSSSEPILHFGLGNDTRIKHLTVSWPSGREQSFNDLPVDRKFTITEPAGIVMPSLAPAPPPAGQFTEIAQEANLSLQSHEFAVDELSRQKLLPMRQNRRGPALAIGDVNGDGFDDVVFGGTPVDPARLVTARATLPFSAPKQLDSADDELVDDGPVLLFDADGDGKPDLLVSRGGNSLPAGHSAYQPRLYFGDGQGGFRTAPGNCLPSFPVSVGAMAAADFDRDGRLDVFLGGRNLPGRYPQSPRSALLANHGGRFEDVTDTLAPGLREVGMVSGAVWSDVDGDGWPDLLLALEWGPVRYFHNRQGRGFDDWSEKAGFAAAGTGWWTSIATADFNGDGRPDYVVGNAGLNTPYHATPQHPALLFAGDFNGDGGQEIVEAYYEGDQLYPWRDRINLGASIPSILKRFPRNDNFAKATLGEILGEEKLAAARRFSATELRSGVFLSQPDGTYRFSPLPRIAQISSIQGVVAGDFDGDGHADIYAVQNSYSPIAYVGRLDGGLSQLLCGDGRGNFTPVSPAESNLIVPGDAKALAVLDLDHDGWPDFLVTRNNSTTLAFRNNGVAGRHSFRVLLRGPTGNPTAVGARITVELADGAAQSSEVYAGSGYCSQSSAACFFGYPDSNPPRKIRVRWPSGRTTEHDFPPLTTSLALSLPPAAK
jgi:hypothetical protein